MRDAIVPNFPERKTKKIPQTKTSWWLSFNPFEKYVQVKLDDFPR